MRLDRVLQIVMGAGFLVILIGALRMSFSAGLAPGIVAACGLFLVVLTAVRPQPKKPARPLDVPGLVSFGGIMIAVGLLGLVYGGALGVLLHLRLLANQSWTFAAAAAATWIVVAEVVFNTWLRAQLPHGLLGMI